LSAALTVALFVVGIQWGALGVAASYAIAMCLLFVPCFAMSFPLIGLGVRDAIDTMVRPLVVALVAGAVAFVVGRWMGDLPNVLVLSCQVAAVAAVYLGISLLVNRSQVASAIAVLRPVPTSP
jgi:hypothetical protein